MRRIIRPLLNVVKHCRVCSYHKGTKTQRKPASLCLCAFVVDNGAGEAANLSFSGGLWSERTRNGSRYRSGLVLNPTQLMTDCEENKFKTVINAQLVEHIGQVMLHGVFAHAEGCCNVLVGLAFNQGSDDLQLTFG